MRGDDLNQGAAFSYSSAEQRVPQDHPLRAIRRMVNEALEKLSGHFDTWYAKSGRPSIAPEKLLRALLLQALYSIRRERQRMEQLNYNLLFRWFVGLNMEDAIWDEMVFTQNRDRRIAGEVSERLLLAVVEQARAKQLLSEEHFPVDGTLIQAWANRSSFHEKPAPPERGSGVGGKKLLRDPHQSKTAPEARLYKKSAAAAAVPSYLGPVITENRNGLVMTALATQSSTTAEREAALRMLDRIKENGMRAQPITLGADKGYREEGFIQALRARRAAPHVAEYEPNPSWPNFLTEAERRHPGFAVSQRKRKLVEKVFGWAKLDRAVRQVKLRGLKRVDWLFQMVVAAHNLRRMQKLIPAV